MATIEVKEVEQYIRKHIGQIRGIRQVAEHFGTTTDALRMQWKRSVVAMSLGRFIENIRLGTLKEQIRKGALCFEAESASGFRDRSAAFRCFKHATGISMRKFRMISSGVTQNKTA